MLKIKYAFLIGFVVIQFTSCLKDKPFIDVSNTQPVIEFTAGSGVGSNTLDNISSQSFSLTPPLGQIDSVIAINIASPQVLDHDVSVTVKLDSSLISTLDTANDLAYTQLPDSMFTVPSYTVTIPAGYRIGRLKVHLNLANYDFANNSYALGFTIVNAPGLIVSSNANSFVWTFDVRNKYDGKYDLTISTIGWAAYGIADGGSNDWGNIGLITSGVSSVVFDLGAQPAFTAGGGQTQFGATDPQFTFDPTTDNLTSVDNLAADDGRGRAFKINPAITDSRYDPSTKTIYAAYIMSQHGRPDQFIYDTLVYKGPR